MAPNRVAVLASQEGIGQGITKKIQFVTQNMVNLLVESPTLKWRAVTFGAKGYECTGTIQFPQEDRVRIGKSRILESWTGRSRFALAVIALIVSCVTPLRCLRSAAERRLQ